MRQCPACQKQFDRELEFCPHDGVRLLLLNPLLGAVIDGKFQIDEQLGRGAMGTVFRATQLNL